MLSRQQLPLVLQFRLLSYPCVFGFCATSFGHSLQHQPAEIFRFATLALVLQQEQALLLQHLRL